MKRPIPLFPALACAALLASALPAQAQSIPDPVKDYLGTFAVHRGESVITATPDLNGDGTPDLLITRNTLANGRQGNLWVCYESLAGGGFRRIDELPDGNPIEFHQKAVSLRPRRDGKGMELVRYSPGGGGEGMLSVFRLTSDGGATEASLGEFNPGIDTDRYASLFENPATQLVFVWEKSDVLLRRHFPLGRWFLHMTPLKWAITALGALAALVVLLALLRVILAARGHVTAKGS